MRRLLNLPRGRIVLAAWAVSLVVGYVGLAASAAAASPLLWAAFLLLVLGIEALLPSRAEMLDELLSLASAGPSSRALVRELTFAVLVARSAWEGSFLGFVLILLLLIGARAGYLLGQYVRRTRLVRPLEVLNIDLGDLSAPAVPGLLARVDQAAVARLSAIPLLVGALGLEADLLWPFVVTALLLAAALVSVTAVIVARAFGLTSTLTNAAWEAKALARLRALDPTVVFYFSGSAEAVYQANMWLKPLADLGRPVLIVLRERAVLRSLDPTDLPVACMPDSVTVMNAKLTTARVALYAAHTGKNIHLLREPGPRHVFIGHGDSDKVSSINPMGKAYDQLWVAGRAGRDRWAKADVGVFDSAVVEVGRPQLHVIERGSVGTDGPPTVLYAPTWEGWTDADFGTSVTDMGPVLVRQILAADPPWRLIYKPHPFTGMRDKRARRAHDAIVASIARANRGAGSDSRSGELKELEARLARPGISAAEHDKLTARWSEVYWAGRGVGEHLVVTGPRPALFDCFNRADVLFSDVSSVVSDFLASGKPYVCANPQGLDTARFIEENPSTSAAYILGPQCAELPEILATLRGDDPKKAQRAALRTYLLGADQPTSIERWRRAVDELAATAHAGRSAGIDPDLLDHTGTLFEAALFEDVGHEGEPEDLRESAG